MRHGFIKIAAMSPELRVADPAFNCGKMIESMRLASVRRISALAFPELGVTGYTCGDLFLQDTLLCAAKEGLKSVAEASKGLELLAFIGVPLAVNNRLYNCAAAVFDGKVVGVVPKTNLPNYGEFYELRHFSPAPCALMEIELFGYKVPFGTDILFCSAKTPNFKAAAEICEDLWVASPPSARHAEAGATVIFNLSASDEVVGKAEYRRLLVRTQSAKLLCGYAYAGAGEGESTTDTVFSGHDMIAENGELLSQSQPFGKGCAMTEIDVDKLAFERRRENTFPKENGGYLKVMLDFELRDTVLTRSISSAPFLPPEKELGSRCAAIFDIQAAGLKKRLSHTGAKTAVVGVSGGLDSTLALLVATRAMDKLDRSRSEVLAVTMPGFGTTGRTRSNAELLAERLGVKLLTVSIAESVKQHFKDIGHDESVRDVVYENAQARERTQVLMDIANGCGGLVIGTGDLSELALGWATYNGDHMSMYGVNASVPKTLIRKIVAHYAATCGDAGLSRVLEDILATPVSPELLPPSPGGNIAQKTEELIGPYELHDFYLFYAIRWAFPPQKVLRVAEYAFKGEYDRETLLYWLRNFYKRFFAQQFKRSCLPDGPKVGTLTLSPRGDWRMPSDAVRTEWLEQLEGL